MKVLFLGLFALVVVLAMVDGKPPNGEEKEDIEAEDLQRNYDLAEEDDNDDVGSYSAVNEEKEAEENGDRR